MDERDKRIYDLEDLIAAHHGWCKINKGRERINIFYGNPHKSYELNKAHLDLITDVDVLEMLRINGK
jgi:hypothetical protein